MLARVVDRLSQVAGMAAVVLGGSYASGAQQAGSDLDVGLYYHEAQPFPIADIRRIASQASTQGEPTVTDLYGWGPWVNGGAWIQTAAGKLDFLYRNIEQVDRTIDELQTGIVRHDYGQQPAFGFYSLIYLAETQVCLPLFDPHGEIARLKHRVRIYPPRLKDRIVRDSLWSAEFTLLHARSAAAAGEVYMTAGCLARVAASLTQALFALNETYFMSDKQAMARIAGFGVAPAGYVGRLAAVLAEPGRTPAQLGQAVAQMSSLWAEVVALAGPAYEPQYRIQPPQP